MYTSYIVIGLVAVALIVFLISRRGARTAGQPQRVALNVDGPSERRPDRESYLREKIVWIAEDEFPDNTGLEWTIHGFEHSGEFTLVELEPKPDEVGYSRFKFVVSFENPSSPLVIATYCLEDGKYSLLSSSQISFELPRELP